MVFCACIGWNSGLPAWMFHCQVPPPDYAFHPEVRGITWVDLVFPFFLFALGLAVPIAVRSRLGKGMSRAEVALSALRRFAILAAFAVVLGNSYGMEASGLDPLLCGAFAPVLWLGFFMSLWRTERKWVNPCGYALVAALMFVRHFVFGVPFNFMSTDVIIMILANVSLAATLVYLLSTGRKVWILLVMALVVLLKALGAYTHVFDSVAVPSSISWLLNPGYLQYLVIVLPAVCIGESMCSGNQKEVTDDSEHTLAFAASWRHIASAAVELAAVVVSLWGFFTRHVAVLSCAVAALALIHAVLHAAKGREGRHIHPAFVLLMLGIVFDIFDGGIAKDYCNLSYLFATCAMAWLMLMTLRHLEITGMHCRTLSLCGQNPMIAYTITNFVIIPLLSLCRIMPLLADFAQGSAIGGLVQGVVLTAAMCACTCFFSYKKIFWRS